jgi:propanol-preferring alcohol dehydrogenase
MTANTTAIDIPKTQKAAVLEDFASPYAIKTNHPVKQPSELAPGECLIKLEYTGVCHSDLHIRNADWPTKAKLPLVGGHEGIGRVVAVGEHSAGNVKVGDRVGMKWIANVCGKWVNSCFNSQWPVLNYSGVKCVGEVSNPVSGRVYILNYSTTL